MMNCELYEKHMMRNEVKKNLMATKTSIDYAEHDQTSMEDSVLSKELYALVDKNLPISLREDWIRFTNKLKLPKQKREALLTLVKEILADNGIEP
jgi:hypothetical protein